MSLLYVSCGKAQLVESLRCSSEVSKRERGWEIFKAEMEPRVDPLQKSLSLARN